MYGDAAARDSERRPETPGSEFDQTGAAAMNRFLIERVIPGASELTETQLAEISGKSNSTVDSLGVPYRWITSYVAGDKVYCIHEADDEETIREHARRGGFPANVVSVVAAEFGPHTAAG